MTQNPFTRRMVFTGHPLDPGQHYPLQIFDLSLCVVSKVTWEDEWRPYDTISRDPPPNTMMWTGSFFSSMMNRNQSSDGHPNTLKSSYWSIRRKYQPVQHAVFKFLSEWIASLYCFPNWQCPTDSSCQQSRQKKLLQTKRMPDINNLLIAPCKLTGNIEEDRSVDKLVVRSMGKFLHSYQCSSVWFLWLIAYQHSWVI